MRKKVHEFFNETINFLWQYFTLVIRSKFYIWLDTCCKGNYSNAWNDTIKQNNYITLYINSFKDIVSSTN